MGEVHGATRNSASADWLVALRLMVRFAIFLSRVATIFRTWQRADGRERYGAAQGFRLPNFNTPCAAGPYPARRVPPLERRNFTLSRAGSVRNEEGVSTLAWSELGWGATQRPSLEHFAGLLGTACRAAELSRKLSLGRPDGQ